MKKQYEAPTVTALGSLEDLTLSKEKVLNLTPDGYSYMKLVLTS